jgi:hypothetical protein
VPVTLLCCAVTVVGTSTIFVAVIFIPFLRPNASIILLATDAGLHPWCLSNHAESYAQPWNCQ